MFQYVVKGSSSPVALSVASCNQSDPFQRWSLLGSKPGPLKNSGTGQCLDLSVGGDPGLTAACEATKPSQQWVHASDHHIRSGNGQRCLDVYDFSGPDVQYYACKTAGNEDENQVDTKS